MAHDYHAFYWKWDKQYTGIARSTFNLTSLQRKKKTSYKTSKPKKIISKCSNRIKDKMQLLIFIKVVLAKIFSTVLIRLHSCVNIGMRQDIGKPTVITVSTPHCIVDSKIQLQDSEVAPVYAGSNATFCLWSENHLTKRSSTGSWLSPALFLVEDI